MKSNVSYQGKVTVEVDGKPGTTRKNSGTDLLFTTLCEILGGKYNDTTHAKGQLYDAIPQYISIDIDKDNTLEISPMVITERIVKNNNSVDLKAVLNKLNVSSAAATSSVNNVTVNLLNDNKGVLATSEIEYSLFADIAKGDAKQCVINWTLTFSNSEGEKE